MVENPITFEKLSWAAFLSRIFGSTGPDAYMSIYADTKFRESLVFDPANVSPKEVCDKLIGGFLNRWRSRFPNRQESASAVLVALQQVSPFIQATRGLRIENVIFNDSIKVNDNYISVSDAIELIFNTIANCYGNRTTAGAKILGVLNPDLFVMWDDSIALHYVSSCPGVFTGQGYAFFLREMQNGAHLCQDDFRSKIGHQDMASYLSDKLGLNPPLPLAKYLDEYNWITITQRIRLPPKWHPGLPL
jgi:hypothetical protein